MTLRRDPDRPVTRRLSEDGSTIIVHIPMKLQKRGGRKLIVLPETQALPAPKPRRDDTLLKAVGRAYRWRRMIETGRCRSITDLAEQEKVTPSYVNRLLPLTILAPDITVAVLDGRQPKGLKLAEVLRDVPLDWQQQRAAFGFSTTTPPPAAT
jgi:hypothetical protein|tara:strand:+ start:321 stop:779 length:459 start_codon:yes stop_codon:yes gene_type:complete